MSSLATSSIARHALILSAILCLALFASARPGVDSSAAMTAGKLDLESIGQLSFGPGDVLFVADSLGTAVYALDLQDDAEPAAEKFPRVEDVDEKVAALLGATARDILIHDLAVHPRSRNVYLSVSRGRGAGAAPVLVKVDGRGGLSLVELSNVPFSKAMITNPPAADAKTRHGQSKRAMTITDIAYSKGHVYVAGLSNEEFESNLRKIPYPFTGEIGATSVEIFHGAHGQFETHAPIRTLLPYEVRGEAHLLAAYTCTPLVTFPLDDLEDGQHLKGTTIAELGFGNRPIDMIQFDKGGEPYVLVLNSSRGGMRIKAADIDKAKPIVTHDHITRETPTAGVPYLSVPMGGVLRVDNFDDESLIVLRRDLANGSLQLRLYAKEWI